MVVADRLGHANATTVLKTYAHVLRGQEDRTRKAMDAAWTSTEVVEGDKRASLTNEA